MNRQKGVTPDIAAKRLGITAHQVRKLCRQGKIAAEKITERQWQIPEAALKNYSAQINQETLDGV